MLGFIVTLIVTAIMIYFLLKDYQAHFVLIAAGFFLLYFAIIFGLNTPTLFGKMKSTGSIWFDPIAFFTSILSSRMLGLGLNIMFAAGYAKYMDMIGASRALATQFVKPLLLIKAPYVVLGCSYLMGQFLNLFIPSASGLALLLMVTLYPVLRRLGIPRLSAAAVMATTGALDVGPSGGNANLAALTADMEVTYYFIEHQIPVAIFAALGIAISHGLFQYYMDKRDIKAGRVDTEGDLGLDQEDNRPKAPGIYLLLPMLPLFLLIGCSPFVTEGIKINVHIAMALSTFIAVACECIRHGGRAIKTILKDLMAFYRSMGVQFASVVTLIVSGEVFSLGLTATGFVGLIIDSAKTADIGATGIILLLTSLIAVFSIIMGSGNAPFFSFAALAPTLSKEMGFSAISMLMPMQLAAGISRGMSPITSVIVAVAGVANLSPFLLVRRTILPMAVGIIITVALSLMKV